MPILQVVCRHNIPFLFNGHSMMLARQRVMPVGQSTMPIRQSGLPTQQTFLVQWTQYDVSSTKSYAHMATNVVSSAEHYAHTVQDGVGLAEDNARLIQK